MMVRVRVVRLVCVAGLLFAAAGCVEVPDTIRAEFAGPRPEERSNYRPGAHGAAPPAHDVAASMLPASEDVPPPTAKAASANAGAAPAPAPADGGAP